MMNSIRPALRNAAWGGVAACLILATSACADPPDRTSDNCTAAACHGDFKKAPWVHQPVAGDACDDCHERSDAQKHEFRMVADAAELCLECHDEPDAKNVHPPVADGACVTCHDPHASTSKHLLKSESPGSLCRKCHESITKDRSFLHGPVAAGACVACHDPHASDRPSLLLRTGPDVCLTCHATIGARIQKESYVHAPVKEACVLCHDPHGGDSDRLLNDRVPDLCLDCHDAIADSMDDATVPHAALATDGSCLACHDPHASGEEHLLRAKPMELCLSCHNRELGSGDSTIANIAELLETNPLHHGPIRQEDCTGCHLPHGGDRFRMLAGDYPAKFYAPFGEGRYALCFECHELDMVLEAETDDLTNFRNGERNLHYLHVNRKTKGRTCRACHDAHASRKPKLVTDGVPFGQWVIPINFQKTPTGGSCQPGCHKRYRYDRDSPVTNLPPE